MTSVFMTVSHSVHVGMLHFVNTVQPTARMVFDYNSRITMKFM